MPKFRRAALTGAVLALPVAGVVPAAGAYADHHGGGIRHVLYLSVDGMHQSDLVQYMRDYPRSALAQLAEAGTEYTNAHTTMPSDSFPGTLAPFTGATPEQTGVYYDVSYSRGLYAPGSNCQGQPGTVTAYDESDDVGAATSTRTILGEQIDPANLPERLNADGRCSPELPTDFVATNSVFGVAHAHGLYTAYSDKHPSYAIVQGHGGQGDVNDLYTPEINADTVPPSLAVARGAGTQTVYFPLNSSSYGGGWAITDSVADTESYDQIKVAAVLNQIDGLRSDASTSEPVPAVFGMNFQSVSVGEKLVDPLQTCDPKRTAPGVTCNPDYIPGGYEPNGDFTPQMLNALNYVNGAVGSIADEINARGLGPSTEIIISAKHGQSPTTQPVQKIGDHWQDTPSWVGGATNANDIVADTSDDIGLLWTASPSDDQNLAAGILANKSLNKADTVYQGGSGPLAAGAVPASSMFGAPTPGSLQADRQPDVIVQPEVGVIYSRSHAKVAEHGGFSADDTDVPLIVVDGVPAFNRSGHSHPHSGRVVTDTVATTQIAPTILQALGLDPQELDGVRQAGTPVLPG